MGRTHQNAAKGDHKTGIIAGDGKGDRRVVILHQFDVQIEIPMEPVIAELSHIKKE